jgi:hypothetical protein
MAAIDPGIGTEQRIDLLGRRVTRLAALAAYVTAAVVGLVLVRPAFQAERPAEGVTPVPVPAATDELRRGESVATFAARHGLDLGELLALNPRVSSLQLPAGTKLRIR